MVQLENKNQEENLDISKLVNPSDVGENEVAEASKDDGREKDDNSESKFELQRDIAYKFSDFFFAVTYDVTYNEYSTQTKVEFIPDRNLNGDLSWKIIRGGKEVMNVTLINKEGYSSVGVEIIDGDQTIKINSKNKPEIESVLAKLKKEVDKAKDSPVVKYIDLRNSMDSSGGNIYTTPNGEKIELEQKENNIQITKGEGEVGNGQSQYTLDLKDDDTFVIYTTDKTGAKKEIHLNTREEIENELSNIKKRVDEYKGIKKLEAETKRLAEYKEDEAAREKTRANENDRKIKLSKIMPDLDSELGYEETKEENKTENKIESTELQIENIEQANAKFNELFESINKLGGRFNYTYRFGNEKNPISHDYSLIAEISPEGNKTIKVIYPTGPDKDPWKSSKELNKRTLIKKGENYEYQSDDKDPIKGKEKNMEDIGSMISHIDKYVNKELKSSPEYNYQALLDSLKKDNFIKYIDEDGKNVEIFGLDNHESPNLGKYGAIEIERTDKDGRTERISLVDMRKLGGEVIGTGFELRLNKVNSNLREYIPLKTKREFDDVMKRIQFGIDKKGILEEEARKKDLEDIDAVK